MKRLLSLIMAVLMLCSVFVSAGVTVNASVTEISPVSFIGDGDTVYYYEIMYDDNDGYNSSPKTEWHPSNGSGVISNYIPEREGYIFKGWAESPDGEARYHAGDTLTVYDDVTLYAVWEAPVGVVTYNLNGGTGDIPAQNKFKDIDINITDKTPTKSDYVFIGWAESPDGEVKYKPGSVFTKNESVVLYAVWRPLECKVIYDLNGGIGDVPPSKTVQYGEWVKISLVTPERDGCGFKGWSEVPDGEVKYLPGSTITLEDITILYAVWTQTKGCTDCDQVGYTKQLCPECNGAYYVDMCPECNAYSTIFVYAKDYWQRCSNCLSLWGDYSGCRKCDYKGYIYISKQTFECSSCNRTGLFDYQYRTYCSNCENGYLKFTCDTCEGEGTITVVVPKDTVEVPEVTTATAPTESVEFSLSVTVDNSGDGIYRFTANASGGAGGYQYQFVANNYECQKYLENNTVCLKLSIDGTYIIKVSGKDATGAVVSKEMTIIVQDGKVSIPTKPTVPSESTNPTTPSGPSGTYIRGDADENGKVNIKDVTSIQKCIAKIIPFNTMQMLLAEVTGDDRINIKDATTIQKYLANLEVEFPIGEPLFGEGIPETTALVATEPTEIIVPTTSPTEIIVPTITTPAETVVPKIVVEKTENDYLKVDASEAGKGESCLYQFTINGIVYRNYSETSHFTFATFDGTYNIQVNVKFADGTEHLYYVTIAQVNGDVVLPENSQFPTAPAEIIAPTQATETVVPDATTLPQQTEAEITDVTEVIETTEAPTTIVSVTESYVYVISDWNTVYCYSWNNYGVYVEWPGAQMEEIGDGLFRAMIPDEYDWVVFNNGINNEQTYDIEIERGRVYNILTGQWVDLY